MHDDFIPNMENNVAFQLRENYRIFTIVDGIVLMQYNAIYDRRN